MTWTLEKLVRTGGAALAAAVASLLVVANYHPCDGLGPLWVLPVICGAIALAAGLPGLTPRAMLVPGLAAATVIGIALGVDYSRSGILSPSGVACEPVQGIAGFALASVWTGVLAGLGLGVVLVFGWLVNFAVNRQPSSAQPPGHENGEA